MAEKYAFRFFYIKKIILTLIIILTCDEMYKIGKYRKILAQLTSSPLFQNSEIERSLAF